MKILKVLLYIFLAIVVLFGVIGLYATKGLKEAKNLQIDSIDLTEIDDGEYTGNYENGRFSNTVKVTIKDHEIVSIVRIEEKNLHKLKY